MNLNFSYQEIKKVGHIYPSRVFSWDRYIPSVIYRNQIVKYLVIYRENQKYLFC